MRKAKQPPQFTDVLMLPVDTRRAEELAIYASGEPGTEEVQDPDEALLMLLFGIAAIEDAEQRQAVALAAGRAVYRHTSRFLDGLGGYMAELYKAAEKGASDETRASLR